MTLMAPIPQLVLGASFPVTQDGGLAQLVASLIASTKLINTRPG